ncbi:hypothetical protein ACGFZZ_39760 [Streptomyces tendae]|uniref:hypothetical protein n=1 Tax=Streptomyces tendae TaxID=1932 RepID=UPI0033E86CA8
MTGDTSEMTTHRDATASAKGTVTEVQREISRLLAELRLVIGEPDALVDACVACLEAAQIALAAALGQEQRGDGTREALYAANAAVFALRFALVKAGDERRRAGMDER